MLNRKLAIIMMSSCLLVSCASDTYKNSKQIAEDIERQAKALADQAASPTAANMSRIRVRDGIYLGAEAVKLRSGQTLPAHMEQAGVRLVAATLLDLPGIGNLVTQATNIPVAFAPDIFEKLGTENKEQMSGPFGAKNMGPSRDMMSTTGKPG